MYKLKNLYGLTNKQMYEVFNEYEKYQLMQNLEKLFREKCVYLHIENIDEYMDDVDWEELYNAYDNSQLDDVYAEIDIVMMDCIREYICKKKVASA